MSDGNDEIYKAQARLQGRILESHGVRLEKDAAPTDSNKEDYAPQDTPVQKKVPLTTNIHPPAHAPQQAVTPEMLRPGKGQEQWSQAPIPSPEETKARLAESPQQLGHNGQPTAAERSGKLDHFPQHEAERPRLGSTQETEPARTPLAAQKQTEQEVEKAKLLGDRATTAAESNQAVRQTAAAEKAAEQVKVQQQAPPTQEH